MDRSSLARIERLNYILGGVLVAVVAASGTREQVLGALVGAVLAAVNFSLLRRIVERMAPPPGGAGEGSPVAGLAILPKMLGLMGAVALALVFLPISAAMLAVGFSVFLLSIGVETVRYVLGTFSRGAD